MTNYYEVIQECISKIGLLEHIIDCVTGLTVFGMFCSVARQWLNHVYQIETLKLTQDDAARMREIETKLLISG